MIGSSRLFRGRPEYSMAAAAKIATLAGSGPQKLADFIAATEKRFVAVEARLNSIETRAQQYWAGIDPQPRATLARAARP